MILANVVSAALVIVVMIIFTWVAIFGGVGIAIANSNGRSAVLGFSLGAVLGPFGWVLIWLIARQSSSGELPDLLGPISDQVDPTVQESDSILDDDDW